MVDRNLQRDDQGQQRTLLALTISFGVYLVANTLVAMIDDEIPFWIDFGISIGVPAGVLLLVLRWGPLHSAFGERLAKRLDVALPWIPIASAVIAVAVAVFTGERVFLVVAAVSLLLASLMFEWRRRRRQRA